jgi:hypothetical protein
MNHLKTIAEMSMGDEQRIELMLVLVGYKKMARIDLYEGDDSILLVQTALMEMGIFSCKMKTSGAPGHLHGFVVSKNKELFEVFKEALEKKDTEVLSELLAPVHFPLPEEVVNVTQLKTKTPIFFKELERKNKLMVA